jgi:hypothetical protein
MAGIRTEATACQRKASRGSCSQPRIELEAHDQAELGYEELAMDVAVATEPASARADGAVVVLRERVAELASGEEP